MSVSPGKNTRNNKRTQKNTIESLTKRNLLKIKIYYTLNMTLEFSRERTNY